MARAARERSEQERKTTGVSAAPCSIRARSKALGEGGAVEFAGGEHGHLQDVLQSFGADVFGRTSALEPLLTSDQVETAVGYHEGGDSGA